MYRSCAGFANRLISKERKLIMALPKSVSCIVLSFFIITSWCHSVLSKDIDSNLFERLTGSVVYEEDCLQTQVGSQFETITSIELKMDVEKYIRDILKKLPTTTEISSNSSKYRKISIRAEGADCFSQGKYRLTGDSRDHVGAKQEIPHSIKIKLKEGNIAGIVIFKLLTPRSRGARLEVLNVVLHKHLGFIAPRTRIIKVKMGGQSFDALLQEGMSKELLEFNNFHEALLIEGDEGYAPFTNPRIINTGFITNDYIKDVSKYALTMLGNVWNKTNKTEASLSGGDPALSVNEFPETSRDKFKKVHILNVAMSSYYGLSRDDTRILYDHIGRVFHPVYYDGHIGKSEPSAADINFLITKKIKNELLYDLKKIDIGLLQQELRTLGADFYKYELVMYLTNAINFIDSLKLNSLRDGSDDKIKVEDNEHLIQRGQSLLFSNQKSLQSSKISWHVDGNTLRLCELSKHYMNCKNVKSDLSNDPFGSFSARGANNIFLYGASPKLSINNNYFKDFEKFQKIIPDTDTSIFHTQDIDIAIDPIVQTIVISRNAPRLQTSQVQFSGGNLDNWEISVDDGTLLGYETLENGRSSSLALTGCLTFNDINLSSVVIKLAESYCEDAVHFVRVNGTVKLLSIRKALSDAVDADFSNIEFENVLIRGAGNDCIDFSAGTYSVTSASLFECGDKGVSAGEGSSTYLDFVEVENAKIGLVAKDSSNVILESGVVNAHGVCLAVYRKKQEFSGGNIKVQQIDCKNNSYYQQYGSHLMRRN